MGGTSAPSGSQLANQLANQLAASSGGTPAAAAYTPLSGGGSGGGQAAAAAASVSDRSYSLRLAGSGACGDGACGCGEQTAGSHGAPPAAWPAGSGAGVADPSNPLRIDAYAAIAASLDPATRVVFEEAVATLKALKAGREQVEAKLKETGREDAIRAVTGTSALDSAIERTESIIRHLGEMRRLAAEAERI